MKHTIKKLPKSELSIDVTVPAEVFDSYRTKALKKLAEFVEVDGFRKGKAPQNLVEKEIKPAALLEEMAEHAVNEHLSKIFEEEKIDAIGRPTIMIKKIALGSELEFGANVAIMPAVKLPDYKKIAVKTNKEVKEVTVSDEELDSAIKELKKAREHNEIHKSGAEHDHAEFEKREFDATLTDEYVQLLGPFKDVAEFKEKFRENIRSEKTARENQVKRTALLDAILAETEVEIPTILIENELEQLVARVKHDIEMAGMSFTDYLGHIKKTEEDMRADLLPDAEKRAKGELVLYTINKEHGLAPKEEEVEKETAQLMAMYKDADASRARAYVTQLLANEAVFKFLDEQV